RLAVHLEDAAAGPSDHSANEVDVVDLARGGRRLMGLIHPLQRRRNEAFGGADEARGLADVGRGYAAYLGGPLGRVAKRRLAQGVEADRVLLEEVTIDPVVADELVEDGVQQREV